MGLIFMASKFDNGRDVNRFSMREIRAYLNMSTFGLHIVLSLIVGIGIGLWLDTMFGTHPLFIAIFFIFGLISGIRGSMKTFNEIRAEMEKSDAEVVAMHRHEGDDNAASSTTQQKPTDAQQSNQIKLGGTDIEPSHILNYDSADDRKEETGVIIHSSKEILNAQHVSSVGGVASGDSVVGEIHSHSVGSAKVISHHGTGATINLSGASGITDEDVKN